MAKRLNCSRTTSPTSACSTRKHDGRWHADLARRDRPRARALDPRIDVAVDQIVPGAAGAAHHDGADAETAAHARDRGRASRRGSRPAPPTTSRATAAATSRSAGRAGSAAGRAEPGRRDAVDPVSGRIGDASGGFAHRAHRVSGLAGQRVENAAALLRLGIVGQDRPADARRSMSDRPPPVLRPAPWRRRFCGWPASCCDWPWPC